MQTIGLEKGNNVIFRIYIMHLISVSGQRHILKQGPKIKSPHEPNGKPRDRLGEKGRTLHP